MSNPKAVVIDYGVGNLLSVRRGLEHCGAEVIVTNEPNVILSAARVVLPGVGAFANGMSELRRRGLDATVCEVALRGVPLLGICLGMQMLMEASEEFGVSSGLGLIRGRVIPVPGTATDGRVHKIPHIGWNGLVPPPGRPDWNGTLLADVTPGEAVYFVHSFMAVPVVPSHQIAHCPHGGQRVSAVISRDNVTGCQFHPEKSGEIGLRILRAFLRQ